jgi:branched-chain amino acid transport system substrate-binding protein
MKNIVKVGAAVACVALAAAACGSSGSSSSAGSPNTAPGSTTSTSGGSTPSGTPFIVGAPAQLSGPNASTYAGLPMTLTAWEKSVNASGGINGHPVKVIAMDTAGSASQGLSVTQTLVQSDHAMAILDFDPSIEQAVLPYLTKNKIPSINALALYPFWNTTPGYFALGIPYAPDGFIASLKALQSVKITSLASVVCAEVAACSAEAPILTANAPKYGIKYDGTLTVSASAANYTAQCLTLKGDKAQAVLMSTAVAVTQKVVANCSAQGYNPTYYFPFQTFAPALAAIPGMKAYGLSPIQLWYSKASSMSGFDAAVQQYGDPAKADMTSMFAWTALETFQAGAEKATGTPSAASVMAGLNSLSGFDADGIMAAKSSFTAGSPSPKIECYFIGALSNGKFSQPTGTAPQCLS